MIPKPFLKKCLLTAKLQSARLLAQTYSIDTETGISMCILLSSMSVFVLMAHPALLDQCFEDFRFLVGAEKYAVGQMFRVWR